MNTWLITGCSSSLGKSQTKAVLEHGDQAIVTARNPETEQLVREGFPQTALPLQLDVTKKRISSIAPLLLLNTIVKTTKIPQGN